MPLLNPSYKATEDLVPAIFVTGDTSNPFYCKVATDATYPLLGVVHDGSRVAPIPEVASVLAAKAGETVRVHGLGDTCRIKLGGSVTAFDRLTATTAGAAITCTTGWYGAIALEDGSTGEEIRCQVEFGKQ
jgi:hypothetical protein